MTASIDFQEETEIAGFRLKVGTEDWALQDLIAAIRAGAPDPEPAPNPTEDAAARHINCATSAVRLAGGATTAVAGDVRSVVADVTVGAGCYIDEKFTEGRVVFKIKRGPFIVGWHIDAGGAGWSMWSNPGNTLNIGHLTNIAGGNQVLTTGALPGVNGDWINIEIETGPNVQGGAISVRAWLDGALRPSVPLLAAVYPADGTYGGVPLNAGVIRISGYTTTPVQIKTISIFEGDAAPAAAQVSTVGRWLKRYEFNMPCLSTTRSGASFRFKATGGVSASAVFLRSPNTTQSPVLAVYKGGVFVRFVQVAFSGAVELVAGLDPAVVANIEVVVSGINQLDSKWRWASGVQLHSISGCIAEPWPDTRPVAIWHGDSITEGSSARTTGATVPLNSCGEATYAMVASAALGLSPVVNGFGGVGLTVAGSGGWPSFGQSVNGYMHNRFVSGESAAYVFICLGTNDPGSAATVQAALVALINDQKVQHPGAIIVVLTPPSGINYAANAGAAAATGVKLIDLRGVLVAGDTTDGTHPTPAGHAKLGAFIASAAA